MCYGIPTHAGSGYYLKATLDSCFTESYITTKEESNLNTSRKNDYISTTKYTNRKFLEVI
jgi:hypothetical protein